ncbi:cell cycle arrest protein BUB3 [Cladophialophora psammophila CBS 110553]|uniref:Cell cycle arrest protein BUB3 n=1 Tax=Cladophialophora psammophila CBS 110553 TaxID=1182543 RepID=W9XHD1_9EURO|nr:cell cycle arrest protein BUB3 [Cladophialophora psammophila CBS 110553]EXJ76760.1 cell cycle arrest protein BUB3 [Cladophialophora psammophila CBS 110553]
MSGQLSLSNLPADAISALRFSPHPNSLRFVVASWDKHAYIYEVTDGKTCTQIAKFEHRAPVLDVCFGKDDNEIYTACLDWDVRRIEVASGTQTVLSTHDNGVRSVVYSKEHSLVVSAAWDSTVHIHPGGDAGWSTATINLPSKPFSLAVSPSKLVVAMANRAVHIYELKTLASECRSSANSLQNRLDIEPWQRRESSLKFMTRAVDCMPNDEGYASSSIEGRVAVEWFDPSNESQARKYAFKCHRQPVDDVDVVYPVNAIAFHPIHGTFATGGGDGVVAIWDAVAKRRIRIYPKLASSVAALSFSSNGKYLATAISPGFEDGKDEIAEGSVGIFIRELGENEVKRKVK